MTTMAAIIWSAQTAIIRRHSDGDQVAIMAAIRRRSGGGQMTIIHFKEMLRLAANVWPGQHLQPSPQAGTLLVCIVASWEKLSGVATCRPARMASLGAQR